MATPPTIVRAAPHPSSATRTFDIPERQTSQNFPDGPHFTEHHRIFFLRVSGARWIVGTPTHDVFEEYMTGETLAPLERNGLFPLEGRPVFAFGPLTAAES